MSLPLAQLFPGLCQEIVRLSVLIERERERERERRVEGEACKFRFNSLLSFFLKRKFLLFVLLSVVSQPDDEEKEEQYLLAMTVISSYPDGRSG